MAEQTRMHLDKTLTVISLSLLLLGLIMVCSSSITIAENQNDQPLFYFMRQLMFSGMGLFAAWIVLSTRLAVWQRYAPVFLVTGVIMLALVLVPGIGREVNGSARWLPLGPFNLQVAELVKLAAILYIADYTQRHYHQLQGEFKALLTPLLLLSSASVLLLLQPDLGSIVVIFATVLAMLFLGGARLSIFIGLVAVFALAVGALIWTAPYRLERLISFLDPWADPFGTGFQLTQALIAFGRGDWFGVGLGSSMQKLFYLPEAHTDFLYSIVAEELGIVGALLIIGLFFGLIWRALAIGRVAEQAGQLFGSQIAYGVGVWLGLQACVNIGVNLGVLPTKGLTLPLMSYGGSSLLIVCVAIALLLRVDLETRHPERAAARVRR